MTGRPHYCEYYHEKDTFYVLCSTAGDLISYKNIEGHLIQKDILHNEMLENSYSRSFAIINDELYLLPGVWTDGNSNDQLIVMPINQESNNTIMYKVPNEFVGMNYLTHIGDYFYSTITSDSTGNANHCFIRFKSMYDLCSGNVEVLNDKFGFKGIPYFISCFDGHIFVTEVNQASGIFRFDISEKNDIVNVEVLYEDSSPTYSSKLMKSELFNYQYTFLDELRELYHTAKRIAGIN